MSVHSHFCVTLLSTCVTLHQTAIPLGAHFTDVIFANEPRLGKHSLSLSGQRPTRRAVIPRFAPAPNIPRNLENKKQKRLKGIRHQGHHQQSNGAKKMLPKVESSQIKQFQENSILLRSIPAPLQTFQYKTKATNVLLL